MKYLLVFFIGVFSLVILQPVYAEALWPVESIDTMKFSRDISREPDVLQRIPSYVNAVALLHPTHIVVATPYNAEFLPVLKTWVGEARKHNLKIWFRGNWSEWEGWFGYPRFTNYTDHHKKTYDFIIAHPELFAEGDIFTPAPEPENGGMGDPRGSDQRTQQFRQFLIDSYNSCEAARKAINKTFICGYFSTNGDVARDILTKDVVDHIGHVVVIDHYVKDPLRLKSDIEFLYQKYQAPIVVGEFGAPIPDIHGDMTEQQQADYMSQVLMQLFSLGDKVSGINYWTAFGGSTKLFENDLTPRAVTKVITSFYDAPVLMGQIVDQLGNRLSGVSIIANKGPVFHVTNSDGVYQIPIPDPPVHLTISKDKTFDTITFDVDQSQKLQTKNIILNRKILTLPEKLLLLIRTLLEKFTRI